jgi:RNA polymerase sigma-70 factor (ECF subfamily)
VVVVLRFYQGFKLQEIAETLQIPLGTVKSRLSVGVDRLRNVLSQSSRGVG